MASQRRAMPTIVAIILLALLVAAAPFLARYRHEPAVVLAKIQKISLNHSTAPVSDMQHSVWVNRRSGLYYCHGSRFYGRIWPGQYMRQGNALQKGFRPAQGNTCP